MSISRNNARYLVKKLKYWKQAESLVAGNGGEKGNAGKIGEYSNFRWW